MAVLEGQPDSISYEVLTTTASVLSPLSSCTQKAACLALPLTKLCTQ